MELKLDNDYTITNDSNCYTLTYRRITGTNPDTGKPIVSLRVRYYPNLRQALQCYTDTAIKTSEGITGAKQLIAALIKINNNILNGLRELEDGNKK